MFNTKHHTQKNKKQKTKNQQQKKPPPPKKNNNRGLQFYIFKIKDKYYNYKNRYYMFQKHFNNILWHTEILCMINHHGINLIAEI